MEQQPTTTGTLPSHPDNPEANQQATNKLPSAFTLFKPSIDLLLFNLKPLLVAGCAPLGLFLFGFILGLIGGSTGNSTTSVLILAGPGSLLMLFAFVLGLLSLPMITAILIASLNRERLDVGSALRRGAHFFLRYYGLAIVTGLITLVGFILLIVPGVFMMKRYLLSSYYLIDKNLGVFEAMRQSVEASRRFSGPVWGLLGVTILIQVPSIVPILGLLVSTILSVLYTGAPAVRYGEIRAASGDKQEQPTTPAPIV